MAVNDVFQVAVVQSLHNQTLMNILYYRANDNIGTIQDLLSAINNTVLTVWTPVLSDQLSFQRLDGAKITPFPRGFLASLTTVAAGLNPAPSLPTSVAATITKQTPFGGRTFRGRLFIGGIAEDNTIGSQLAGAALTQLQTLADRLSEALTPASGALYSPGYLRRPLPPPNPPVFEVITGARANPILRNQRRRQIGVGI